MKHITFLISIFFINTSLLFSQNNKISELINQVKTSTIDSVKVKSRNQLSWELRFSNPDTSILLANEALAIAKKIDWKKGIASSHLNLSVFHGLKSEYTESINHSLKALKINEELKNKSGMAINLNNLGLIYSNKSEYNVALDYYLAALKINEELNNKSTIAGNYNNIANLHQAQDEHKKAIEYYLKALKINEELNKKQPTLINLSNLGATYLKEGNYSKALEYFLRCLNLNKDSNNKKFHADVLGNIGAVYLELKDFKKSEEYLLNATKISEELGLKKELAGNWGNIGFVYTKLGRFKEAEDYLNKALLINKSLNYLPQIKDNELFLFYLYDTLGNYKLALQHYINASVVKDTLLNESKNKELTKKELNYEHEKKSAIAKLEFEKQQAITHAELEKNKLILNQQKQNLLLLAQENELSNLKLQTKNIELDKKEAESKVNHAKIELLNQQRELKEVENKRNEEQIKRQEVEIKAKKNQQYALFIGLLLVLVFSIFIYNRFKITQKQKNIIEKQKNEVIKSKDIIETQKHLVEEKNKEILDSIIYAKRLQEAILPPQKLVKQYLENSFILYKPKDIVAGDFYWLEAKNDLVLFAAADCTGHGVPGAMVSVVCSNALNRTVKEFGITEPGKILDKVKELVLETFEKSESEVKDGMDVSLCGLNLNSKKLYWSGANNPLWIIRNNDLIEYSPDKQPIGKTDKEKDFVTHKIELQTNDCIYIFTDGYVDQFGGEKGKKLKSTNFKKLLLSINNENMTSQREKINQEFENWRGDLEQVDDVCVIGVRI